MRQLTKSARSAIKSGQSRESVSVAFSAPRSIVLTVLLLLFAAACGRLTGSDSPTGSDAAQVVNVELSPSQVVVAVEESVSVSLTALSPDSEQVSREGNWFISDSSVARVVGDGSTRQVIGKRGGSTRVIASVAEVTDTTAVEVTQAEPVFEDDFDSGSLKSGHDGFGWGAYVKNRDPETGDARSGVYPDIGRDDSHGFRFYAPGKPDGEDVIIQINFNTPGVKEIWVEYWFHIPSNYKHRAQDGATNQKFFQIYDNRHDPGLGVIPEIERNSASESHMLRYTPYENEDTNQGWFQQQTDRDDLGNAPQEIPVIVQDDHGSWVQYRWHVKTSDVTASYAGDEYNGVLELWKNGKRIHKNSDLGIRNTDPSVTMDQMRIWGWQSAGYDEDTIIVMDNFRVWTEDPGW